MVNQPLRPVDLVSVIYSSGKVFDGLNTGRLDTEKFLRSGDLSGVTSRSDLALLEDLRDAAQYIIDHADLPVDAAFVRSVNRQLTRSAAITPGKLRTDDQGIGVDTAHGRHTPPALDDVSMGALVDDAIGGGDLLGDVLTESAIELFLRLARAQPFEDGNKRTALFTADALLIKHGSPELLSIPTSDDGPELARRFNDALARYYIFDEADEVKRLLRIHGLSGLPRS